MTPTEMNEALQAAKQAVQQADLPEQWQERAFGEVLRSLLGGRPAVSSAIATLQQAATVTSGVGMQRLAARFGVSEEALADVIAVDDEAITVHVASGKLPTTKSRATRELALLVVAARQGVGFDEAWTDVQHVRDSLMQYNRYDQGNFAKYLRETQDVFNFRGKPIHQLRLTRPGWEAAIELVKGLIGSPQ
jgi:transposase-like protein